MEVIADVNYRKLEEIGALEGRNSAVFRVFDHYLGAELVVKEIEKARLGDPSRFFQEARAFHAAKHDRVVPIHWAANRPDHVCIAMPMMAGSLAGEIRKRALCPSRLIAVAQDICEGVAQVHIANLLHLDIKPTNVLLDRHGRAAITDFGQSLQLDSSGTADASGHPLYRTFIPPEIAGGSAVATSASDVYQIGLTLYRAINGERRFGEERGRLQAKSLSQRMAAIARGDFPEKSFLPFVPLGIRRAILRALAVDPVVRQVGARALAEELAAVEVRHDWQTDVDDSDECTWRLRPHDRADVIVSLLGKLPNARVEIWTESASDRRRKAPPAWSKGIRNEGQLKKALSRAFRAAAQ